MSRNAVTCNLTVFAIVSQATEFNIFASNFIDDPNDYPLAYQFSYSINAKLTDTLSLGQSSSITHTSSMFPAGTIYCILHVSDIYDGYSISTANTTFVAYQGNDLYTFASSVLTSNLNTALSTSNSDKAMQTINMVSILLLKHLSVSRKKNIFIFH